MAGYAAFKSGDQKKSIDYNLCCLDIIKSLPNKEAKTEHIESLCYYNLSVSSALLYQRSDSEEYIAKALEIVVASNVEVLKPKVISFYEEYFGEIQVEEESAEENSHEKMEFNFLPGAPETANNKIIELRCETPKERKRTKTSKRSLSRN